MPQKQVKTPNNKGSADSLYKRIATGLTSQPAYLLVFAISALFFLTGAITTAKAVMSNDFRFGVLALVSFTIALCTVVIVVREVERKSALNMNILAAQLDRSAKSNPQQEQPPVDTPRLGKRPTPLDLKDERVLLAELPEWTIVETEDRFAEGGLRRELHRAYEFIDFDTAFNFMNEVAGRAIAPHQHHPRWQNTYNRVEVWLTTFNLGYRLSARDRRLARLLEQIWEEFCKGQIARIIVNEPKKDGAENP